MDVLTHVALLAALFTLLFCLEGAARLRGYASSLDPEPSGKWSPPEWDIDPVCGSKVRTANAKPSLHNGNAVFFCSRDCREIFEAAPELYPQPPKDQARNEEPAHG